VNRIKINVNIVQLRIPDATPSSNERIMILVSVLTFDAIKDLITVRTLFRNNDHTFINLNA